MNPDGLGLGMERAVHLLFVVMIGVCAAGCPPIYTATFCNATAKPLTVSIREAGSMIDSEPNHRAEIRPWEQRRLAFPAWCQQVEVSDASGVSLWRREIDFGRRAREDRGRPGSPSSSHLLSESGVFVIRCELADAWRDNIELIMRNAPPLRLCTPESYPYNAIPELSPTR